MQTTTLGPCYGAPALAVWLGELAVAWVDPTAGTAIRLATGPVRNGFGPGDIFAPTANAATGMAAPDGHVAITSAGGSLLIAWVDAASNLQTAVNAGGGFGAATQLATDVLGAVRLAAGSRVFATWRTIGNQVMLAASDDGVVFDAPIVLNHTSVGDPGIAVIWHPYHGETVVITVDDTVVTASPANLASLNAAGQPLGIGTRDISVTATRPPASPHVGVAFVYQEGDSVRFRPADLDLQLEGADLRGPACAYPPAALGWGGDLIVAYVEIEGAQRLRVGSWVSAFGVPPDLVGRIGQPCDPRQCSDDPRLVCILTGHQVVENQPAQISNAHAGEIVLSPGDGHGVIGTILKALQPAQFYDHNGLMLANYTTIRHCTQAKDRVMKDKDYFTGSLLGDPAPTDGLRPDLIEYGWPGPITQSIQNAFFDGFNDGLNSRWDYHERAKAVSLGQLGTLTEDQQRAFYDKERPEKAVRITNLTFVPTYRDDYPGPLYPRVVKPPQTAGAQLPWVSWAQALVVAEAAVTTGHYRFYAYTDARTATDPGQFAPPVGDAYWNGLPAGADWAAGTPGIVCSTFVWLAARRALDPLRPRLLLDADPAKPQDSTARAQPKEDGLYAYTVAERIDAARSLHDWIVDNVQQTVKQRVDDSWPTLGRVGVGILVGVLAGTLTGPVGAAAAGALAAAALSPAELTDITTGLTQMPERVANGVCNAFANDRPEDHAVDDHGWATPGPGLSVSPDNMWTFWDPPAEFLDFRAGLWGASEVAMLANPRPEVVDAGTWQLSEGVCTVTGSVSFNGQRLFGAEVFVGCKKTTTDEQGNFSLDVMGATKGETDGEQPVRVQAYWDKPPGMLTKRLRHPLPPGAVYLGQIELDPPPEWRRRIEMHGELRMVHQVLLGHDTIDHHMFSTSFFVQADPDVITIDKEGAGLSASTAPLDEKSDPCGGERAHLFGSLRVLDAALDSLPNVPPRPPGAADLSIVVDWTFEILDGDNQVDHQTGTLVVPPGQTKSLTPALNDGDEPPDRAYCNVFVDNFVNPA